MKKLFGVYRTESEAQRAVDELRSLGYREDEISVFSKHNEDVENITGAEAMEADNLKTGAATGAAAGAAIGTVGAALAAAGALFIPGIGPILAAGPIATLLTGAVAGGAIGGAVGTLAGALANLGVDEDDAQYIDERFNQGDIVVHVDVDDNDADRYDRTNALLGETLRRDLRDENKDYNLERQVTDVMPGMNPAHDENIVTPVVTSVVEPNNENLYTREERREVVTTPPSDLREDLNPMERAESTYVENEGRGLTREVNNYDDTLTNDELRRKQEELVNEENVVIDDARKYDK